MTSRAMGTPGGPVWLEIAALKGNDNIVRLTGRGTPLTTPAAPGTTAGAGLGRALNASHPAEIDETAKAPETSFSAGRGPAALQRGNTV